MEDQERPAWGKSPPRHGGWKTKPGAARGSPYGDDGARKPETKVTRLSTAENRREGMHAEDTPGLLLMHRCQETRGQKKNIPELEGTRQRENCKAPNRNHVCAHRSDQRHQNSWSIRRGIQKNVVSSAGKTKSRVNATLASPKKIIKARFERIGLFPNN